MEDSQETTEVETPVEADNVEVAEGGDAAAEAEAEAQRILDLEEYGSYGVPITVNGEERTVPLSQVRDGLMMQADYTQKSQANAEAIAIAEALDRDYAGTRAVLDEYYGFTAPEGVEKPVRQDVASESLDPLEREVEELKGFVDAQVKEQERAALDADLERVGSEYGVDSDEVLAFAVQNGIPNLDWAASTMLQGRQLAEQRAAAERAQAEEARAAAKREAGVVSGGGDRASGASGPPAATASTVQTIGDAFRLAKAQQGA